MPLAAPYREPPGRPGGSTAGPSSRRVVAGVAALALAGVLVAPVIALAMQPFSTVATLVAGFLAATAAATYARIIWLSR